MRFMMLVIPKGYETAQPDQMPDAAAVRKMMKYNEDLANAGVLLGLEGLKPRAHRAGARGAAEAGARFLHAASRARRLPCPRPAGGSDGLESDRVAL